MCKIDFDSLPIETPIPHMRVRAFEQAGKRVRLVEFGKEFVEPGWCETDHVGYVVPGRLEIEFENHTTRYVPGDGILIQGGEKTRHRARVLTDAAALFLVDEA